MKAKRIFFRSALGLSLFALCGGFAACSDDDVVASAVDSKTVPFDNWQDTSYAPGDNFFMYVNGKYWNEENLGEDEIHGFSHTEFPEYFAQLIEENAAETPLGDLEAVVEAIKAGQYDEEENEPYAADQIGTFLELIENAQSKEELASAIAQIISAGGSAIFQPTYTSGASAENALLYTNYWALDVNMKALSYMPAGDLAAIFEMLGYDEELAAERLAQLKETYSQLPISEEASEARRRLQGVKTVGADQSAGRRHLNPLPDLSLRPARVKAAANEEASFEQLVASELGDMSTFLDADGMPEKAQQFYEVISNQELDNLKALSAAFLALDYLFVSPTACSTFLPDADPNAVQAELFYEASSLKDLLNYTNDYYIQKAVVSDQTKAAYTEICEEFRSALSARIETRDWMSATTKAKAQEKLAAMKFFVGGPDEWITEAIVNLEGSLYELLQDARKKNLVFTQKVPQLERREGYLQGNMALGEADMTELNGFYVPDFNMLCILPALMTEKCFSSTASDAYNYAFVAWLVGHEIVHGFDNTGAKYDKEGVRSDWWTIDDGMEFKARYTNLVKTFNNLQIYPEENPDLYCNGEKTLGENIADLGGVNIGLDAYKARLARDGYYGDELTKQLKKYIECYAGIERCKYTLEFANTRLQEDEHALSRERVNGIMMNVDDWYDLYNVGIGSTLYLSPSRRAYLW